MPNLNINSRIYKGRGLIKVLENYTVLDIETTSLDCYRGEILEISAIKVRNQQETEYFSELIKIHNKVGALVLVLKNFKDFLGDDIIVGHNVNFDINFIYDSMKKNLGRNLTNDYVDTLRIARKVLPHLKHHKLDDLIKYFNLVERNEHRALNDCILTNQVYIRLGELLEPHRQQSVI